MALVLAEGDLAEWGVAVLRVGVFWTTVGLGGGGFLLPIVFLFVIVVIFGFMQRLFWNGNVRFSMPIKPSECIDTDRDGEREKHRPRERHRPRRRERESLSP